MPRRPITTSGSGAGLVTNLGTGPWRLFKGWATLYVLQHGWLALTVSITIWAYRHGRHNLILLSALLLSFWVAADNTLKTQGITALATALILWGLAVGGEIALTRRRVGGAVRAIIRGRARVRRFRKRWTGCAVTGKFAGQPDMRKAPKVVELAITRSGGVKFEVDASDTGRTADDVVRGSEGVAAHMRADQCYMGKLSPYRVVGELVWGNELNRQVLLTDLLPAPDEWYAPFGVTQGGGCAYIPINKGLLVGGMSGSGKSSLAWTLISVL